ncbi:MAG: hypothetical protein ACYC1D_10500 [Acidimicrobiales bacterium]
MSDHRDQDPTAAVEDTGGAADWVPHVDADADAGADTDEADTDEAGAEEAEAEEVEGAAPEKVRGGMRSPAWAVLRAVVVLGVAAGGYQLVVPVSHTVRSRLAGLVVTRPGVKQFDVKPATSAEQPAAVYGLAPLSAAAKRSPNQTGVYLVAWMAGPTNGAAVLAFLLPNGAQAASTMAQIEKQQLAANSNASAKYTRRSTFSVKGIPGSAGALYAAASPAPGNPAQIAITVFRVGRAVAAAEVGTGAGAQAIASTVARSEHARLLAAEPHFTFTVVTRSVPVTVAWAVAAVVLALLAALAPYGWRRRSRRLEQRRQEELANQVIVGSHVITKRRL